MYKYIVFDVDGTLIDTERAIIASLKRVLKEAGVEKEFSDKDLTFVLGIPGAASLSQLGIEDIDSALVKWNRYMKDYSSYINIFPGVEAVVSQLKDRGISLGVVTSKTREELEYDFVPYGLAKHMDHMICADDTENHKPHPDPILKFIEKAQVDPAQLIYIGDTPYDCQCAREAGVKFGLALWGAQGPGNMECEYIFSKPEDIINTLFCID